MRKHFLLFFTLLTVLTTNVASAVSAPAISSPAWILIDRLTNTQLAAHNEDKRINPGNSVLLMVIYTIENLKRETNIRGTQKIVVNNDALAVPPLNAARFYLEPNKAITIDELVKIVAVMGANDAAIALAEGSCQTVERFVEQMNRNAQRLGMKDTHYVMPIGTNSTNQYTSASDTLILANTLLNEFPALNDYWSVPILRNGVLEHKNSNLLLSRNSDFKGMHTSSFSQKHWSSIIFYSRDFEEGGTHYSRELLGIALGTPSMTQHADNVTKLMGWGADNYKTILIYPAGDAIERIDVEGTDKAKVRVGIKENLYVTLPRKAILRQGEKGFSVKLTRLDPLVAPIEEGEKIGDIHIYFNQKEVATAEMVALHAVQRATFWGTFTHRVKTIFGLH